MSFRYIDKNGAASIISGLTPGGNLETGAVATREGNIQITVNASSATNGVVTFVDPMPDADYEIIVQMNSAATSGDPGNLLVMPVSVSRTVNGFNIAVWNYLSSAQTITVHWKAFKLYEVADAEALYSEVTDIKAMIPSDASSTNKFATADDLRSETRSLDRRLDDVEDVIPNNAAISNKLATASDVAAAMANAGLKVVDTFPINPSHGDVVLYIGTDASYSKGGIYQYSANLADWVLISTAEVDLSHYRTMFKGTTAQWNTLSSVEKNKYELVSLNDDEEATDLNPVDAITNGEMRPVTSNAVYDKFTTLDEIRLIDLTPYVNTNIVSRVGEYLRAAIWGRLVIIDFGGITFSTTANGQIFLSNLPFTFKNRAVINLMIDSSVAGHSAQNYVTVYNNINGKQVNVHAKAGGAYYGQMVCEIAV